MSAARNLLGGDFVDKGFPQQDGTLLWSKYYGGKGREASSFPILVALHLYERNGLIERIQVTSQPFNMPSALREFTQHWRRYSLDQVLTRYGEPCQVWVAYTPALEPGASPLFDLTLAYDHLGFRINYTQGFLEGPVFRVCPHFEEVSRIFLRLEHPHSCEITLASFRKLEEATGMDVQTFYETFRQVDSAGCLESPAELWP